MIYIVQSRQVFFILNGKYLTHIPHLILTNLTISMDKTPLLFVFDQQKCSAFPWLETFLDNMHINPSDTNLVPTENITPRLSCFILS